MLHRGASTSCSHCTQTYSGLSTATGVPQVHRCVALAAGMGQGGAFQGNISCLCYSTCTKYSVGAYVGRIGCADSRLAGPRGSSWSITQSRAHDTVVHAAPLTLLYVNPLPNSTVASWYSCPIRYRHHTYARVRRPFTTVSLPLTLTSSEGFHRRALTPEAGPRSTSTRARSAGGRLSA